MNALLILVYIILAVLGIVAIYFLKFQSSGQNAIKKEKQKLEEDRKEREIKKQEIISEIQKQEVSIDKEDIRKMVEKIVLEELRTQIQNLNLGNITIDNTKKDDEQDERLRKLEEEESKKDKEQDERLKNLEQILRHRERALLIVLGIVMLITLIICAYLLFNFLNGISAL